MAMTWHQIHLRAALEAARAHRELRIDTSQPIDPFSALANSGVMVFRRTLAGLAGLYLPGGDASTPGVLLNVAHPLSKQRYTAAHELAHHRRDRRVVFDTDTEWLSRDGSTNDERERFAEAFAAWFLMPRSLVRASLKRLRLELRSLDPVGAYRLALELGTSYQATINHLGDLRLLTRPRRTDLLRSTPRKVKRLLGAGPGLADSWRDVWVVHEEDERPRIHPLAGDAVLVEVEGAPSTGYLWQTQDLPHGVALVSQSYRPNQPDTFGGRGRHVFLFRVSEATSGPLRLELRRPWETRQPANRLEVGIVSMAKPSSGVLDPMQLALA
jgi:Zn-dependent peptidase ImmA (M78 family)